MKRSFLFAVITVLSVCAHAQRNVQPGFTPRGEKPPVWLKNKVTQEQYDTLSMLNMRYDVCYDFFKRYGLSTQKVQRYMVSVRDAIVRADTQKRDQNTTYAFGGGAAGGVAVHPLWVNDKKGGQPHAEYLLCSSMDGYDAHVRLSVDFQKLSAPESFYSTSLRMEGCSFSGVPVTADVELRKFADSDLVKRIDIGKDGSSPLYNITGKLTFEDPLGYKHVEYVNRLIYIAIH